MFEFQRHGISSEEFCSRLDTFFGRLPKDFRYAVEIRNASLLGRDYRKVLESHGVAHVYNHWSSMPPLRDQHQRMEEHFTASFTVLRLLTPLKMSYEAAKKRAEPYTKIVGELLHMHRTRRDPSTSVLLPRRTQANLSHKRYGNTHIGPKLLEERIRTSHEFLYRFFRRLLHSNSRHSTFQAS